MKRTILAVSLAILALAAPLRADRVTVAVTVTGAPTHGVTFVLNGDSRSWVTNSPSATQFLISSNGASANATNFYNAIAARLFAGQITVQQTATNVVKLYGSGSQAMVASLPGTWGTLTVTTNASTDLAAVRVPVSSEPTAATRTNIGTQLAEAINSFSTNRLLLSVLPAGLDTNPGASYLGKTSNAVSATTANTASNALLLGGLTFPTVLTNGQSGVSLYSTTPGTVDNSLLVNAGFVRSLLQSGTFFYNSSNLVAGSFINGAQAFQYQPTVDATISTRTYSGVTNNQYIGATMTTQTFTSVSGPATIEAYLTKGGSGSATVLPEIYFTIDGTNTFGDYAGAAQTITTGTNLYSWVMSFPTTTTNVPFRVVRQLKVISQTSTPDITLSVGGARDSRISFGTPMVGTDYIAASSGTGSNITLNGTTTLTGPITAAAANSTAASDVANVGTLDARYSLVSGTPSALWLDQTNVYCRSYVQSVGSHFGTFVVQTSGGGAEAHARSYRLLTNANATAYGVLSRATGNGVGIGWVSHQGAFCNILVGANGRFGATSNLYFFLNGNLAVTNGDVVSSGVTAGRSFVVDDLSTGSVVRVRSFVGRWAVADSNLVVAGVTNVVIGWTNVNVGASPWANTFIHRSSDGIYFQDMRASADTMFVIDASAE